LLLGAFLSMGAAPLAARAGIDPIVDAAVSLLGDLVRSIPRAAPPRVQDTASPSARHAFRETPEPVRPNARTRRRASPDPKPSGGILVRSEVVRAAVERGIRPSASPVAATADRPAGLIVYGWGAAGAGFADGDIITRVGGRDATSVDDVVIAVAGAYKTKSHVVSGQIWRNGQVLVVTVQLPLPKRKKRVVRPRPRDDETTL
jgi:hypothetical protein